MVNNISVLDNNKNREKVTMRKFSQFHAIHVITSVYFIVMNKDYFTVSYNTWYMINIFHPNE